MENIGYIIVTFLHADISLILPEEEFVHWEVAVGCCLMLNLKKFTAYLQPP